MKFATAYKAAYKTMNSQSVRTLLLMRRDFDAGIYLFEHAYGRPN